MPERINPAVPRPPPNHCSASQAWNRPTSVNPSFAAFRTKEEPVTEPQQRPANTSKGLCTVGKRMWRRILAGYELRPDELFLLENACKVANAVARLEAAMQGEPLMVKGSMNQLREHPLLSEARQQRALLARLLGQLKAPRGGQPAVSRVLHAV